MGQLAPVLACHYLHPGPSGFVSKMPFVWWKEAELFLPVTAPSLPSSSVSHGLSQIKIKLSFSLILMTPPGHLCVTFFFPGRILTLHLTQGAVPVPTPSRLKGILFLLLVHFPSHTCVTCALRDKRSDQTNVCFLNMAEGTVFFIMPHHPISSLIKWIVPGCVCKRFITFTTTYCSINFVYIISTLPVSERQRRSRMIYV